MRLEMLRSERPPLRLALLLTGVLVVLLAGPVGLASRTSVLVSPSTDRAAAGLPSRTILASVEQLAVSEHAATTAATTHGMRGWGVHW